MAAAPTKPNAHRYVKELGPGERLEDQIYLINRKDLRSTTNGGLYIHLVLGDRTPSTAQLGRFARSLLDDARDATTLHAT